MSGRVEQFQRLVAQQPDNELFRFSLAQALLGAGCAAEAEPHLVYCCTKKADWMLPRILLGKSLLSQQRRAEAKPWLTEALQLAVAQVHEDPERELRSLLADL